MPIFHIGGSAGRARPRSWRQGDRQERPHQGAGFHRRIPGNQQSCSLCRPRRTPWRPAACVHGKLNFRAEVHATAPCLLPPHSSRKCIEVFVGGSAQVYGMTETHRQHCRAAAGNHVEGAGADALGQGAAVLSLILILMQEIAAGRSRRDRTRPGRTWRATRNLPEATARTLGRDGWLRTETPANMEKTAILISTTTSIHDHLGGENIDPAEVEANGHDPYDRLSRRCRRADQHPGRSGQKAIVATKPGKKVIGLDIINFTRERIAASRRRRRSISSRPARARSSGRSCAAICAIRIGWQVTGRWSSRRQKRCGVAASTSIVSTIVIASSSQVSRCQ